MSRISVVEHHRAHPSQSQLDNVAKLAYQLRREHAELRLDDELRDLFADRIEDGPTLHLDDLTYISFLDEGRNVRFIQDRARLRAGDGDFVVSCTTSDKHFERYCQEKLCLGTCSWLHAQQPRNQLDVAVACWQDAGVREQLIDAARSGDLVYLHPYMGTLAVWELAVLISEQSGAPLKVIAPPPRLTRWLNNKVLFAHAVSRLFGPSLIPCTNEAFNLSMLAERIAEVRHRCRAIVLKIPDSAGGSGNLLIDPGPYQKRSLREIRRALKDTLQQRNWDDQDLLLVGCWETDVFSSPSAQLWIPPEASGMPIVEGVYEQILAGPEREFVGSRPAGFPARVTQEIVDRCWLLARLFQQLGYVGRCSFDLLLVGQQLDDCRLEFVECNGRWGGTSLPMSLMNRLFGDWATQPYATQICQVKRLNQISFGELLSYERDELFDAKTRRGNLIFFNPGRMQASSAIDVIALGETLDQANQLARHRFPDQLKRMLRERSEPHDRDASE